MKVVSRDMCRLAWATSICLNSISIACKMGKEERRALSQEGKSQNHHTLFHQVPYF
jgi:hypothetical protein